MFKRNTNDFVKAKSHIGFEGYVILVKTSQRNDWSGTIHSAGYGFCRAAAIQPVRKCLCDACRCKICRLSKKSFVGFHMARDFVARGRPLRGQKRLVPLAKRSTCNKSIKLAINKNSFSFKMGIKSPTSQNTLIWA